MIVRQWMNPHVEDAFFDVKKVPLFFCDRQGKGRQVSGVYGVYDSQRDSVISVVSSRYQLVSNFEAYRSAQGIVDRVFHDTKLDDMQFFNLTMPKTRSFMHLDLVKPNSGIEPFKNDPWTAFLRITNSYNHCFCLTYEIGFCRYICMNGMIFGSQSVKITFVHGREGRADFENLPEKLKGIHEIESSFCTKLNHLRSMHVSRDFMEAVFFMVFPFPSRKKYDELTPSQLKNLSDRKNFVQGLIQNYADAMGYNGYAMLNILTDFASYPTSGEGGGHHLRGGYQRRVGDWMHKLEEHLIKNQGRLENFIPKEAFTCAEYVMNAPSL